MLEVLVVVLIIGIVIGIATLTFSRDPGDRLQTEAQRFAALLTLAAQESVLQAREYAVVFDDHGYGFLTLDGDGKWVRVEDRMFRARELPDEFHLDIAIEGEQVDLSQGKKEDVAPRIYLLSSGEMTPFELTLRHEQSDAVYRVRGDIGGKIDLGA